MIDPFENGRCIIIIIKIVSTMNRINCSWNLLPQRVFTITNIYTFNRSLKSLTANS